MIVISIIFNINIVIHVIYIPLYTILRLQRMFKKYYTLNVVLSHIKEPNIS